MEEIPELFDSAVREAVSRRSAAASASSSGSSTSPGTSRRRCSPTPTATSIVVGTRDCSLQRRNQKLVEEAPAPFLTDEQRDAHPRLGQGHLPRGRLPRRRHRASTSSAPTARSPSSRSTPACRSSTRCSEETTGIDLVRQQFRIADGEELEITEDPDAARAQHRVPDQRRGRRAATSCPAPGPVTRLEIPQGPGVRWDSGVETGGEVAGAFDSMLAKLIVTGATRERGAAARPPGAGRARSSRACRRSIPFHRAVVRDEAFTTEPFTVHTRWIETEWDNQVPPYDAAPAEQRRGRARGRPSSSRSADAGSRSRCPPASPPAARPRRAAAQAPQARRRQRRLGRVRRLPDLADAGHDRQGRRRGRRHRRGRRPDRRPRGDEDGAADHRPQGGHGLRAVRRGRRRASPAARSSAPSPTARRSRTTCDASVGRAGQRRRVTGPDRRPGCPRRGPSSRRCRWYRPRWCLRRWCRPAAGVLRGPGAGGRGGRRRRSGLSRCRRRGDLGRRGQQGAGRG